MRGFFLDDSGEKFFDTAAKLSAGQAYENTL